MRRPGEPSLVLLLFVFLRCFVSYFRFFLRQLSSSRQANIPIAQPCKLKGLSVWSRYVIIFISGIAHVERDWRNLQLIIAVPPVIFLIAYYFIPESPRWLISQKRIVEAEAVLKKAVKVNKGMDMEHLDLKLEAKEEPKHKANILDLFKTRNILKNTIIQYVNWFTASFVYYALTFDSGTLIPGRQNLTPWFLLITALNHRCLKKWTEAVH